MALKSSLEGNLTQEQQREKELQAQNKLLQTTLVELQTELDAAKVDGTKLQTLMTLKTSLESNLSQEQEREKALQAENQKLQSTLEQLQKEVENAKAQEQELQALMTQKQALEANLTTALQEEEKFKTTNSQLQANIEQLKQELDQVKSSLEDLKAQKVQAQALLEEKASLLKAKEEEIAKIKALAEEKALALKSKEEEVAKAKAIAKQHQEQQKQISRQRLNDVFKLTHVEFKYNSMDLTDKSKRLLDETARVMRENSDHFHFIIKGHTDNTGRESYNIKLSGQRAEQVKKYLVSQGVDENILSTQGVGSAEPIADNATRAGRLKNRRVEFKIIENDE